MSQNGAVSDAPQLGDGGNLPWCYIDVCEQCGSFDNKGREFPYAVEQSGRCRAFPRSCLTQAQRQEGGLFGADAAPEPGLYFGNPPNIALRTRVPEDVWGAPKKKPEESTAQIRLIG